MAGKTEWEDALIKHGVMEAPKEQIIEDDIDLAHREALQDNDPLANLSLDQLNQVEDDFDEDIIETYRRKRLMQLREEADKTKYGSITQIAQKDFVEEVTEGSANCSVVCLLFARASQDSELMEQCLSRLAHKFKLVKVVKILGSEAIKNFPDSNCPTLLLYKNGDLVAQIPKLATFGGKKATPEIVEWVLSTHGILKTELEKDPRDSLFELNRLKGHVLGALGGNKEGSDDSDDDEW